MSARAKYDKRLRSSTDPDVLLGSSTEFGEVPSYRARLSNLFEMIEKEFDALYLDNCNLRAKLAALSGDNTETSTIITQETSSTTADTPKGRKASAMLMGQKLRTALRVPPSRLVFKVGGGDGSRFVLHRQFEGHRDGVWHVSVDPTRTMCATASTDQTARVYSVDTGTCLATYRGHTGSVNCVTFAPSEAGYHETTLATASGDESAHIWRMSSSRRERNDDDEKDDDEFAPGEAHRTLIRLTGHTGPVIACDWMGGSGGTQLVTASWDRTANIFDVSTGKVVNILSGHEQELTHCSSHSSQKLAVTASTDSTFRLWDFREAIHSVAVFQGHQNSVTSVVFSADDNTNKIISGSDDRTVKIWDLRNMRNALSSIRLRSSVNRISVSKAHGLIAIPLDNRHVRIYDINGNSVPRIPNRRCHSRLVTCAAWVDDNPYNNLLTSGFDRRVCGWKVALSKD